MAGWPVQPVPHHCLVPFSSVEGPQNGTYRVGVHAYRGNGRVTVRIYCGGSTTTPRQTFGPTDGPAQLIFGFEAVVIGGLGSLWGTLLGGIILGVAQTVGNQIDVEFDFLSGPLFGHLIFLAVLAFRPTGLLGARNRS